jgi:1-acyl-sn-glycerol-3-phosphate acyltransferase
MIFLRSFLFNILFFFLTVLCSCSSFLLAPFGRKPLIRIAQIWGFGTQFLLKRTVGITYEIKGKENIPTKGPYIFACKHQSAWDTTIIQLLAYDAAIILKRELLWVPIFGQILIVAGAIGINRAKGKMMMSDLIEKARKQADKKRPIFIFPEGTRVRPDAPPRYKYGIYALYCRLNLPVVPAALNSGYFWPRRGFLKHPGHITVQILPQIKPGLPSKEFMTALEGAIEGACKTLSPPLPHQKEILSELTYDTTS